MSAEVRRSTDIILSNEEGCRLVAQLNRDGTVYLKGFDTVGWTRVGTFNPDDLAEWVLLIGKEIS